MNTLEIFISGKPADQNEALRVNLVKVVTEFRNPNKKTGERSYTIKLPKTQKNRVLFDYQSDRNIIGKFRKVYDCEVHYNSVPVLVGSFIIDKITKDNFEGQVYGKKGGKISDILDGKLLLNQLQSFTKIDFTGDYTVWDYMGRNLTAQNSEVAFPYIPDSFAKLKYMSGGYIDGQNRYVNFENFGVSHFTAAVFKNIFMDAGYTLSGPVLSDDAFNRLVMLYTNSGEDMPYNYAKLNILGVFGYYHRSKTMNGVMTPDFEAQDYKLYVANPEYRDIYNNFDPSQVDYAKSGDQAFCMSNEGIYTCNYTSNYTFSLKSQISVMNSAGTPIPHKQYLVFREIGNDAISEGDYKNYSYASINLENVKDIDTYNTDNTDDAGSLRTSFTARLVKGKRYRAQVYVFIKNDQNTDNLVLNAVNANTWLSITAVDGHQLLDPAKFLPDMGQLEFVQAIFKLFNLYYQIDEINKDVKLFTRDEFFEQSKSNILDISHLLDMDEFDETPLTANEIAETYYKWANDESDYLLAHTNYMDLVNGDTPEEAYELPFAPLAFLAVKIKKYGADFTQYTEAYDLIPFAIPATDATDMSVLDDYEANASFSYKPKLALYTGAGIMADGSYATTDSPYGFNSYKLSLRTMWEGRFMPKLTFFNVQDQPAYEVTINAATREFFVNEYSGETIYTDYDPIFISDAYTAGKMDIHSLANEGDKSMFQKLYANDLSVTNWSNFAEGTIRMNPVLYNNLNGRNILRIEDELYLLESIKNYDLTGAAATIKFYRMLSA